MSPERYQKICDIFAEAQEIAPEEREKFLSKVCGDDVELREEVESLLDSDKNSNDFIESPALEIAAEMLAADQKGSKSGLQIGQYKIVSLLGAGGMGEVWLADDARLKRQIALKLLAKVQRPDFLARFEQEAYAASALNHPNIITIFDIGESEGFQFIATEYINGKTLRQILREKLLTTSQAVEIAVQICAALSVAHAAGIIHRDIKPENIMIRSDGIVKILDFGLARYSEKNTTNPDVKNITKPGMVMGTVSYMSPEQARALPVDERTDVFSLGIVLFEMLTGALPFQGENEIETLAAILEREPLKLSESFPEPLRNIVTKALRKKHTERPTAAEMFEELQTIKRKIEFSTEIINQKTSGAIINEETAEMTAYTDENSVYAKNESSSLATEKNNGQKVLTAAAALLLVAVGLGAIYKFYLAKNPPVLTDTDKILIAEFENKTGDDEFDGIFRQPLAISLAQSPFINLVSDGQIRQTLKTMEKPPDERLTVEVAREICQRRGIKAFLKGSIENYGVEYLITLEAFKTETGESVVIEKQSAKNKEEVLLSLNKASEKMREKLGESLASIEKFDSPIPNATTSSLEALKTYSLANQNLNNGKNDEAINLFKRTIELDPNFAAAYAALGTTYYNKGQFSTAEEYARKAFELRERTTEREKLKIADFYYAVVSGEIDKNIETLELFKQTYPRDFIPLVNLGETYMRLGKFAKAEENTRLAISMDQSFFAPYSNLGKALNKQSKFQEARAVFEDMKARNFDSPQINTGIFTAAFALGDEAEMGRQVEELRKKEEDSAIMLEGNKSIFTGRWAEYSKFTNQAVGKVEKEAKDIAADYSVQAAVNSAALGKCDEAKKWANRALNYDKGYLILIDASFALSLCHGDNELLISELKNKYPSNTVVNSMWMPLIRAASEMETAPDRALETLEINRQFEGGVYFWDNYLRGKIYLKLGKTESAVAEFQKIIQNRGWSVQSPLFALAHRELSKAYAMQNDSENAKKYSDIFTNLWKNADADLPVLKNENKVIK